MAYVPMALGRTGEPMTPATTLLLAFSMSLDAFAAALSKGAALKGQRLLDALRTGVIFGVIEAITPVIGWAFGFALSMWIREIDHWVAFILLSLIGGHDVACAQASGCSTRSNAAFSCTFATHCIRHERGCHGGRGHTCIRSSQYLDPGSRDWRCDFHHGSCRNVGGTMGRAAIRKSGGGNRRSMSHRDWSSDLD